MFYKPGDKVAVFEDPITRLYFEGEATIVRHHRDDWYDVDFNYLNGKHVRRKVIRPPERPEQTEPTKEKVAAFKLAGADALARQLAQKLRSLEQEAKAGLAAHANAVVIIAVQDLGAMAKLAEDIQQTVRPT